MFSRLELCCELFFAYFITYLVIGSIENRQEYKYTRNSHKKNIVSCLCWTCSIFATNFDLCIVIQIIRIGTYIIFCYIILPRATPVQMLNHLIECNEFFIRNFVYPLLEFEVKLLDFCSCPMISYDFFFSLQIWRHHSDQLIHIVWPWTHIQFENRFNYLVRVISFKLATN